MLATDFPLKPPIMTDLSARRLGRITPAHTMPPALWRESRIRALTQRLRRDDLVAGFSPRARALTGNLGVIMSRPQPTRTELTAPGFARRIGEISAQRAFDATQNQLRRTLRRVMRDGPVSRIVIF
jgi:hypothetical protein